MAEAAHITRRINRNGRTVAVYTLLHYTIARSKRNHGGYIFLGHFTAPRTNPGGLCALRFLHALAGVAAG